MPRQHLPDEPTTGQGPGDVKSVPPEDLSPEAVLTHRVKASNGGAIFSENLKRGIDSSTAFRGGEVGLGGSHQDPSGSRQHPTTLGAAKGICQSRSKRLIVAVHGLEQAAQIDGARHWKGPGPIEFQGDVLSVFPIILKVGVGDSGCR